MPSKGTEGEIDLDEEKIFVSNKWMAEKELKKTIKKKVDGDDFDIAAFALSLKSLKGAIDNSKIISVRIPLELSNKLESIADSRKVNVGVVFRESLFSALGVQAAPQAAPLPAPLMPAPPEPPEEEDEDDEEEDEEDEDEEEDDEEEDEEDEDEEEDEDDLSPVGRGGRRLGRRGRRRRPL